MVGLEKLFDALPNLEKWWRRYRYPARVEFDLEWKSVPVQSLSGPMKYYRALCIRVVAGKVDDFVVAEGEIQARASPTEDWTVVSEWGDHTQKLPIEVEANRAWDHFLSASTVAREVEAELGATPSFEIRVLVSDHHGTTLESPPVETSGEELRAEKSEEV